MSAVHSQGSAANRNFVETPMETINPYAATDEAAAFEEPPQTSKLAIASLVCGLIFCCPITSLLAPLLGIGHFIAAAGKPWVRGAGLAIGGILLGLVMTGGWVFLSWASYQFMQQAMRLPDEALAALSAGDVAEFRSKWSGLEEGSAGEAQIAAFRQDLENRYGSFESIRFNEQVQEPPAERQQAFVLPFIATFSGVEDGVMMNVTFVPTGQGIEIRIVEIEVIDERRGDIVFPGPDGTPLLESGEDSSDEVG
ncbi:MAG: hypothetical protein ACO38W_00620 [Phycisphaerales bacterium]